MYVRKYKRQSWATYKIVGDHLPFDEIGFCMVYLFDTIDSIEARQYLITQGKICKNSF